MLWGRGSGFRTKNRSDGPRKTLSSRMLVPGMLVLGLLFLILAFMGVGEPQRLIALTFDDGPSPYTEQLLDGLAQRGARATFFMAGKNGDGGLTGIENGHNDLLSRMLEEGHQLANHTYSHKNFDELSSDEIEQEVSRVDDLIRRTAGEDYDCYIRIPGGHWNENIADCLKDRVVVKWSLDTHDWASRNADEVCAAIVSNAKNGDIVLLHDLYPTSIEGALRAVDILQDQGYKFVTVEELLAHSNSMERANPILSAY